MTVIDRNVQYSLQLLVNDLVMTTVHEVGVLNGCQWFNAFYLNVNFIQRNIFFTLYINFVCVKSFRRIRSHAM